MKIAVIGANGKAGKLIVKEAVQQGLDVTAIVRHPNQSAAQHVLEKDLFDLTKADLQSFDVVVDAFGVWGTDKQEQHQTSLKHLCDALSGTQVRLIVVGGAGSLYLDQAHTQQLVDAPNFPDAYKPTASNMAQALKALRQRQDINWTYLSPAADFQPEGERTGKYQLGGEEFTVNAQGESVISYADYALALVDEIVKPQHLKQRFCVVRA